MRRPSGGLFRRNERDNTILVWLLLFKKKKKEKLRWRALKKRVLTRWPTEGAILQL